MGSMGPRWTVDRDWRLRRKSRVATARRRAAAGRAREGTPAMRMARRAVATMRRGVGTIILERGLGR